MTDTTFYWSRFPGRFVVSKTGADVPLKFKGTIAIWHELLVETIIDCIYHMQTLVCEPGLLVSREPNVYVHPDIVRILKTSVLFKAPPEESTALGKISDWYIYEDATLSNDVVKIVVTFNGTSTLEGQVKILDMPENGRKA